MVGGGGGGKPHIATAGGKDVAKIPELIEKFKGIVEGFWGDWNISLKWMGKQMKEDDTLTLNQVKASFEHKSISKRIIFLAEYHFDDNYQDYYKNFIINYFDTKDNIYFMQLLELAQDLEIYDEAYIGRLLLILKEKTHIIVKLSILDYLYEAVFEIELDHDFLIKELKELLVLRNFLTIKNTILFILSTIDTDNKKSYTQIILENLKRTKDYRTIIRLCNFIMGTDENLFDKNTMMEIIKIGSSQEHGLAVKDTLNRFETWFQHNK